MPAVLLSANANAIPIGSAILYVNSFDGIDGPTCQDQANPCKTIGYALTKAVSGDTIKVAPGTYNGDLNISQGVTLEGANYNISGNQKRLSESMINGTVTINSSDVTINGFTISPSSGKDTVTANFNTPYSNDIVSDNIINAPYAGQIGVHLNDNDSTVSNNIINYSNANAIGIETSNNSVDNFSVVSNNFVGLAENAPADITIIGSTPVAHDINISNNSSSSGATLAAIFNTNTATINDNTSINAAPNSAIYIGGNDSNVTVTDNTVHGAGKGIKIDNSYGDGPNSDVTATNNDLSSNAIGAVVTNGAYTGGLPNFSDNWWGNANGPFDIVSTDGSIPASNMDGKGSPAIGAMIYSPWCTDEYCLHDTNHLLAPTNIHMLDNTHNNYAPLPPGPVPTTTNTTQLDLVWNPVPG
ncbi:MAG TPA: hypothetical protein VFN31_01370, partial [Candidatus Saccharimonadales bacterium]|nr:hypothetical protein [Candidatus Saccharimonadales bacterium]